MKKIEEIKNLLATVDRPVDQVLIEARIGGDQGALEGGDRILDVFFLNSVRIYVGERDDVGRVVFELADDFRPTGAHFPGMVQWSVDLIFEGFRAAIPELFEIEAAVENGRRVDRCRLSANSDRPLSSVHTSFVQSMATGASYAVVAGKAFVVEKTIAQRHLSGIQGDRLGEGRDGLPCYVGNDGYGRTRSGRRREQR